jgi:hypothetical protein
MWQAHFFGGGLFFFFVALTSYEPRSRRGAWRFLRNVFSPDKIAALATEVLASGGAFV